MKASELMTGDFVTFKDSIKEGDIIPIQIVSIDLYGNCFVRIGEDAITLKGACDDIDLNDLSGVPLTEEILEKNGFRWDGSGQRSMMLATDIGSPDLRYNIYVGLLKGTIEIHAAHPIETEPGSGWRKYNKVYLQVCGMYVHELQHALRLCGVEIEIKL